MYHSYYVLYTRYYIRVRSFQWRVYYSDKDKYKLLGSKCKWWALIASIAFVVVFGAVYWLWVVHCIGQWYSKAGDNPYRPMSYPFAYTDTKPTQHIMICISVVYTYGIHMVCMARPMLHQTPCTQFAITLLVLDSKKIDTSAHLYSIYNSKLSHVSFAWHDTTTFAWHVHWIEE